MAAILISVYDIKYLKTWLAINEESIYGSTAIRDKILATFAIANIGKFPCAFWRLSAHPGLTAVAY
jgi:hypothetical protein